MRDPEAFRIWAKNNQTTIQVSAPTPLPTTLMIAIYYHKRYRYRFWPKIQCCQHSNTQNLNWSIKLQPKSIRPVIHHSSPIQPKGLCFHIIFGQRFALTLFMESVLTFNTIQVPWIPGSQIESKQLKYKTLAIIWPVLSPKMWGLAITKLIQNEADMGLDLLHNSSIPYP